MVLEYWRKPNKDENSMYVHRNKTVIESTFLIFHLQFICIFLSEIEMHLKAYLQYFSIAEDDEAGDVCSSS